MLLSLAIFIGSFELFHLALGGKVVLRVRLPHAARNVLYFVEGFFRRVSGPIDLRGSLGVLVECSVGKFASRAFDVDLRDALRRVGVGIEPHGAFDRRLRRGIGVFGLGFYVWGAVAGRYAEKVLTYATALSTMVSV